jgi:hypothetical protein
MTKAQMSATARVALLVIGSIAVVIVVVILFAKLLQAL